MESATDIRNDSNNLDIPILTLAALFNEAVSIDWLQALSGERASKVLAAMEEGVLQGILKQSQVGVYAFKHPEKQSECLSSFSEEEKAMLHRRVADLIRKEFSDEADMLPTVAHHLMNTVNGLDDSRKLFEAGEALRRTYRQQDALQCYAEVIGNLKSLVGTEADQLFVDAVMRYARLTSPLENPEWIIAAIREAMPRAEGTGMHPSKVLFKMHLAKFEWYRGRQTTAIRQFSEGWAMAQESDNPDTIRYATTFRMFFFFWQGRYHDVVSAYEESATALSRYPRSGFPILTTSLLGESLASCGRVTEGLGMLDGLQDHCREIGDTDNLGDVLLSMACIFLEIGRADDALQILSEIKNTLFEKLSPFSRFVFHRFSAAAFALKKEYGKTVTHIREITALGISIFTRNIFIREDGFIQMAVDMEEDELFALSGQTAEQIIQSALKGRNVFTRGMGYLFKARLLMKKERPPGEILKSLKLSIKWLKTSGHELQLSKTRFDLVRVYLQMGNRINARKAMMKAHRVLARLNPSLIPEDLSPLLEDRPVKDDLLNEILALGQEIVTIRDNRELVMRILSAISQLAGTERGAIFLVENSSGTPVIKLSAAKNLTDDHVDRPSFSPSMDIIRETISSGTGRIVKMDPPESAELLFANAPDVTRSCSCVPIVLKGEIIGALYGDNRFLESSLEKADLNALSFLSGQLAIALDNARAYEEIQQLNRQLMDEKQYYVEKDLRRSRFKDFIGKSSAMQRVFDQINRVADQDTVVLIQGETGVGKELVAMTIQRQSERKERPFISADCSAFSETLITSELFGHEKGAFTGAQSRRIGRFELAHGGTLFLDEIGNIPVEVQVRLLRVLQTKEFQRVGGIQTVHSDFRLITSTNKNLDQEVAGGRFREDLYYRLNVFPISVPPLRERRDDIPLLALYFLRSYSTNTGKPFDGIPKAEMRKLLDYPWPGNVRELQSVVERGVILSSGSRFKVPELTGNREHSLRREVITLAENERRHILRVLEQTGGKIGGKNGAAKHLDLPDSTLYSRMKKLGIASARSPGP